MRPTMGRDDSEDRRAPPSKNAADAAGRAGVERRGLDLDAVDGRLAHPRIDVFGVRAVQAAAAQMRGASVPEQAP